MNEWISVYIFLSWRAKGNLDHYQNDPGNDPHCVGFFFLRDKAGTELICPHTPTRIRVMLKARESEGFLLRFRQRCSLHMALRLSGKRSIRFRR